MRWCVPDFQELARKFLSRERQTPESRSLAQYDRAAHVLRLEAQGSFLRRHRQRAEDVAGRVIGQDELCLPLDDGAMLRLEADHVAHERIGWDSSVSTDDMPGLGERDRVFDRHVVFQSILVDQTHALDEMDLIAVWRARPVIRCVIPHTDRVDHKRVTLPVTDRMPAPSGEALLFRQMAAAVGIDAAMLAA